MEWSSKRMTRRGNKRERDSKKERQSECYVSSLYQQETNRSCHDIPHIHRAYYQYLRCNRVSHDLRTDMFLIKGPCLCSISNMHVMHRKEKKNNLFIEGLFLLSRCCFWTEKLFLKAILLFLLGRRKRRFHYKGYKTYSRLEWWWGQD